MFSSYFSPPLPLFPFIPSYYGVSDLEQLCIDTHKFESQYLTGLIGGSYPEQAALYRARSPLHASHQVACPVVFFQGVEMLLFYPSNYPSSPSPKPTLSPTHPVTLVFQGAEMPLLPIELPILTHPRTHPVTFVFQGAEDAIVPPNQAETMIKALREKQLPLAYVLFPGERHGFREANNLKTCLEGELYFYSTVLNIPLGSDEKIRFDNNPPIVIENIS